MINKLIILSSYLASFWTTELFIPYFVASLYRAVPRYTKYDEYHFRVKKSRLLKSLFEKFINSFCQSTAWYLVILIRRKINKDASLIVYLFYGKIGKNKHIWLQRT